MGRGPMLRVVASLLFPFAAALTLYFLFAGHNNPGGGFIAGVLMSGAIAMQFLAHGPEDAPRFLKLPYLQITVVGFFIAAGAGLAPLFAGRPFLTSLHASVDLPILGVQVQMASAQVFDIGIFLLVAGAVVTALLALRGDGEETAAGE